MREVEVKALVNDKMAMKEVIESIVGKEGKAVQKIDQYMRLPGAPKESLRLRDNNGILEITTKKTSKKNGKENNLEYEFTAEKKEFNRAHEFFKALGYEDYFRKSKNGFEWTYDEVHIELLDVNDIGCFLEMEQLMPFKSSEGDVEDANFHLEKLLSSFGLKKDDVCSKSYRSMILGVEDGV